MIQVANLMDQLAENAGVPAAPAPVNTVREFIAPAVSTETPAAEELPPPVVEEAPKPKTKRKSSRAKK